MKIRRFDRLSTGTVRAKAQFRLRRERSSELTPKTQSNDKTVTSTGSVQALTPALRLGLVGTCPTGALALMAQQHEVVHVIYCQSLSVSCLWTVSVIDTDHRHL